MRVIVDLVWGEGEPRLSVQEGDGGLRVVADLRLSQAQVLRACGDLGDFRDEVRRAWEARVGLSDGLLASGR